MRIAVVSEGTSDIGRIGDKGYRGAVRVLVERLLGKPDGVEFTGRKLATLHGRGGLKKKVKLSVQSAHLRGDDGIAIVVDNDCAPPGERRQALAAGAEEAGVPIRQALGLAVQMMEAWLIADEKAASEVLGFERQPMTGQDPEKVKNPKRVLNELARRRLTGLELQDIARLIDLERIESRCTSGFGRFASEVRHNLWPLCNHASTEVKP